MVEYGGIASHSPQNEMKPKCLCIHSIYSFSNANVVQVMKLMQFEKGQLLECVVAWTAVCLGFLQATDRT